MSSPAEIASLANIIIKQLKGDIKTEIQKQFASAKRDFQQANVSIPSDALVEDLAERAAKKARVEIPTFKRKGNQKQYEHNRDVLEEVNGAISLLDSGETEKAKKRMEDGKKIIMKRQKLIKIADREEDGWDVVRYYESDDLTSNSEDKKEIFKARRQAASEKKKVSEKKRKKGRFTNFQKSWPRESFRARGSSDQYRGAPDLVGNRQERFPSKESRRIVCFLCGKEGHMRYNCSLNKA